MLKGVRAITLGAILMSAGCLGSGANPEAGIGEPETCLLGGAPRDVPEHREVFNLTEDLLDRLPVLSQMFRNGTPTITMDCEEGRAVFETLQAEGADVVFYDEPSGHNAYLHHNATLLYVVLRMRI